MQRRYLARCSAAQLPLKQVGEQVVVAKPGPRRVQGDYERVRFLQVLQHTLPAAASGQQVGELAVDLLQHAGPQQQPLHFQAAPAQHLGQKELGHSPLATGELRCEPLRLGVPGQRQCRQSQPGGPPLGPLVQQRQRRLSQLYRGSPQQLARLLKREPQVFRAQLGQLTL